MLKSLFTIIKWFVSFLMSLKGRRPLLKSHWFVALMVMALMTVQRRSEKHKGHFRLLPPSSAGLEVRQEDGGTDGGQKRGVCGALSQTLRSALSYSVSLFRTTCLLLSLYHHSSSDLQALMEQNHLMFELF